MQGMAAHDDDDDGDGDGDDVEWWALHRYKTTIIITVIII